MTNIHKLIDVGTIQVSALLLRDAKFFARSLDSRPLIEVASQSKASVDDLRSAGERTVTVDTLIGAFEAAYMPWQWRGPDYPTLIYHHGSGERPFDFGRFSSNSFRRLFAATDQAVPANLVAVRAPFHDGSNMDYARAMGDLENFVGMLAASVGLIDALATQANDRTSHPVLASGISLGGWAVNLHRACFDTVDQYVPIFAGAALGEMFVSSVYRKMTAGPAQRRSDHLREVLDFEEEFRAVEMANCAPLLARYDRIIEYDRQHSAYAGMSLSVLDKGHVTGSLATDRLREHVLRVLSACDTDRVGRA
ncbi:hypothetical protein VB773_21720 [Haloarculaceae archaeon H-GB2-1]|nr:hypothetical protein [Haloarculaceae archaeon H-GB1-1]MEA5389257.1 hypothetical protein [Haloarculaceae archaeon H-GB11]MEA5409928.1 hypothetical protein [Haloarculaceae archaeon H-GB2-1]